MNNSIMFVLFNNKHSYNDLDLIIEKRPNIPVPERKVDFIEIDGRDGSLTEDQGTYKDIEIPVEFALAYEDNLQSRCRLIKQWLIGGFTEDTLSLDDDLQYFYKVKAVKVDKNIQRQLEILGRFTAVFVCEPFSYSVSGLEVIDITQSTVIYNEGFTSKPYLKIYGSGDVTLAINNKNIILNDIESYIELDSDIENCFKGTDPTNDQMIGEFPLFSSGENHISWTGSISKIEVIPRWRWL